MKRGFQTRDAEMDLARLVGDLDEHGTNQADTQRKPFAYATHFD